MRIVIFIHGRNLTEENSFVGLSIERIAMLLFATYGEDSPAIRYKDCSGNVKTWLSSWLVDDCMGNFYMLTPQESKEVLERSSHAEFTVKIPDDCAVLLAVSVNVEYLTWEDFTRATDSADLFRKFNSHRDYVSITL